MAKAWPYNPHTPCLALNITLNNNLQQLLLSQFKLQQMIFAVEYMQFKTCVLKLTMLILYQPLSQPATFLVAKMWFAGTPSEGMCYHKHTLPTCYICHLSSHISYHISKAIWPYYPHWLYSPQVLYLAILYLPHSKHTALGLCINAVYIYKHCLF